MTDAKPYRIVALIVILAMGAFFIRLPNLEARPMHGDEANQAYKTGILYETGKYEYDPHDHHGPTLYYLALIPAFLSGADNFADTREATYRIVPVVFGAALIALLLLLRPALPATALITSGLLIAISPAFVFYSRYYIQEMLLVFFTLSALGFGYHYFRKPSLKLAIATGASLSLMHATKETAIIAFIAMAAGLAAVLVTNRKSEALAEFKTNVTRRHVAAFVGTALVINVVLYTAFFTHARGPLDSILTYGNYLKRADGAGMHDKPWYYYLQLLIYTKKGPQYWFSEAFPVVLGFLGFAITAYQTKKRTVHPFVLFLSVYTFVMVAVYSLIPYKTPWTMLSLYLGLILLAGYAVSILNNRIISVPAKAILALVFIIGLAHLGHQSRIVNHTIPADPRNPYVYAHTSTAHLQLIDRVYGIQAIHPDPESMRVYVIQPNGDYWPLPFYLRGIEKVGFFHEIPSPLEADIIIAAPSVRVELEEAFQEDYFRETGGLRPSVLRVVYIKRDLWNRYMEDRQ